MLYTKILPQTKKGYDMSAMLFSFIMALLFLYIWNTPDKPKKMEKVDYKDFFIDDDGTIVYEKSTSIDIIV